MNSSSCEGLSSVASDSELAVVLPGGVAGGEISTPLFVRWLEFGLGQSWIASLSSLTDSRPPAVMTYPFTAGTVWLSCFSACFFLRVSACM